MSAMNGRYNPCIIINPEDQDFVAFRIESLIDYLGSYEHNSPRLEEAVVHLKLALDRYIDFQNE